jgi:hypothetical protein
MRIIIVRSHRVGQIMRGTHSPRNAHLDRPRKANPTDASLPNQTLATCPRSWSDPPPAAAIRRSTHHRPYPCASWAPRLDAPAKASSAVTARSPTPRSSGGGRQHERWPHTGSHGGSQSPAACWRLRTSILHLELTGRPRYPSHLLSSPHLPTFGVYLDFIFLLLLQNCSVSGWGGGAPRPVLLGGSADQGCREVLTFIDAQVRRKSYLKVFHLVTDLPWSLP